MRGSLVRDQINKRDEVLSHFYMLPPIRQKGTTITVLWARVFLEKLYILSKRRQL